jgi:hypothetical protein
LPHTKPHPIYNFTCQLFHLLCRLNQLGSIPSAHTMNKLSLFLERGKGNVCLLQVQSGACPRT